MKLIKNQSGFTLMEMVVAIGVVSLISSLVLSGVISANTNNKTATIISYMDKVTMQAKEVFQVQPDKVLSGSSRDEPYQSMSNSGFAKDASGNEIPGSQEYITYYSGQLGVVRVDDINVTYRLNITFLPEDVNSVPGFNYQTVKYKMTANVYEKKTGSDTYEKESIYTKVYEFDEVTTNAFATIPDRNLTVTFHPNGGEILLNGATQGNGDYTQKYYNDEYIYGGGRFITAAKADMIFIGWSTSNTYPDSRILVDPNTYKIAADQTLYAQYLKNDANKEYRLQFNIGNGESWNNGSNYSSSSLFFEKELPKSSPAPLVKEMDTNINTLFQTNVVKKRGYKFLYWADSKGTKVDPNSRLNDQFVQLYPVFEKLANDRTEVLSLNVMLDLTNISAGASTANEDKTRMYAIYPFTKMIYTINYVKETDSFDVIQTETIDNKNNKFGTLPDGLKDGDVLSSKTFHTISDGNVYLTSPDGNYQTLADYVNAQRTDSNDPFIIDSIDLSIKAPSFDLAQYFSQGDRDTLSFKDGSTLDASQANKLLSTTDENKPSFIYSVASQPMNSAQSITDIKERIAALSKTPVYDDTFNNIGYVSFQNSGNVTYNTRNESYTTTTTVKEYRDTYLQAWNLKYTIPFNAVHTGLNHVFDFHLTPEVIIDENDLEGTNAYIKIRITPGGIWYNPPLGWGGSMLEETVLIDPVLKWYSGVQSADATHENPYEVFNYIKTIELRTVPGETEKVRFWINDTQVIDNRKVVQTGVDERGNPITTDNEYYRLNTGLGGYVPYYSPKGVANNNDPEPAKRALKQTPEGSDNVIFIWNTDEGYRLKDQLLDIYKNDYRYNTACGGNPCGKHYQKPFPKSILEINDLTSISESTNQDNDYRKIGELRKIEDKTSVINKNIASFEMSADSNYLPPFIKSIPFSFN